MLSPFDYAVIVFYLSFLVGIGWYFRHTGKDSSEYFRGGGVMPWWLVGASGFMGAFSAWTFTGAAGLAYDYGWGVIVLYWANGLGFLGNWAYFARWSRNTRAITALEAVRERLGPLNEQVFTWLQVPFQVLQAGIWLYGLAIFCTPALGFDLRITIVICGVVIVFVAAAGGSWAVVAGDFIKALVLIPITIVAAWTALQSCGGLSAFVHRLPSTHWDLTAQAADFGPWWILAVLLEKITHINGLHYASRYLCVSDGSAARKAALLSALLFFAGSVFWFIPPMVARIVGLPLGAVPGVANPAEMSYLQMAAHCLPVGLLGLLVTGIVSSTLSAMDTGLNRNAGIFVRSFYQPVLRPQAQEKELVIAGRLTTLAFGGAAILMALFYSTWKDLGVFQLMMNFSALVATPYAVPLFWCLWLRRTPDWSAWSTILLCFLLGGTLSLLPQSTWAATLADGWFASSLRWIKSHYYIAVTITNIVLGSGWLLLWGYLLGDRHQSETRRLQVHTFFRHRDTDLGAHEREAPSLARQKGIAAMCLIYGAFLVLLAWLSPTSPSRWGMLFCAAFMLAIAGLIFAASTPASRPPPPPR